MRNKFSLAKNSAILFFLSLWAFVPQALCDNKPNGRLDSANDADTIKSWTSENPPTDFDSRFLNSLVWHEHKISSYVLRLGHISKWVAALQFVKDGKPVLTEYTPPSECIVVLDPKDGSPWNFANQLRDLNGDGIPEIAFGHYKLNDAGYHMYSVYDLASSPKLIWKSGGRFGDWLHRAKTKQRGGALWTGTAEN